MVKKEVNKLLHAKSVKDLETIDKLDALVSLINEEIAPAVIFAESYEELLGKIERLTAKGIISSNDVYFKNERVKLIYSLLYSRVEVRNKEIGYSEELLTDKAIAKKWYTSLVKKIHPDVNQECESDAELAMHELEIIYNRIKLTYDEEE